jgi:uncharacterized protein
MNKRAFLLAGASNTILSACAYKNAPFSSYNPLFYRVKSAQPSAELGGAEAYLFGAVHLGLSRFYPLPEPVEAAWSRSDCLAVELDIDTRHQELREAFSKRVLLPAGETLDEVLSASEIRAIKAHMGYDHQDWSRLRRLQPWALSLNLFNKIEANAGPQATLGIDLFFLRRAKSKKLRVAELEQPQDQVEAFAGGSRAEQLEQLRNRLQQLERYERTTELVIDAWRHGDALSLAHLKRDSFGDDQTMTSLHQRMSVVRDKKMAASLASLIREGARVFCVVGAFHLVGPNNLLEVLRVEHGLEVSLVSA